MAKVGLVEVKYTGNAVDPLTLNPWMPRYGILENPTTVAESAGSAMEFLQEQCEYETR